MRFLPMMLAVLGALCALGPGVPVRGEHRVDLVVVPRWGEAALVQDSLALETGSGQRVSVSRCDLLVSAVALQRPDGEWMGARDWAAFFSTQQGRLSASMLGVPEGRYVRMRFHVGVPAAVNARDPAGFAPGDALNPVVNGLHWGWAGGFVFAAVEGRWRGAQGIGGYSYHVATDANLMTVELPVELDLSQDLTVTVALDLARFFDGLEITEEKATTHSREGDPLAALLRGNMEKAWRVLGVARTLSREEAAAKTKALIGKDARPFGLTFSRTFPRPELPLDNPLTHEGVSLGRRLFDELKLSGNGRQSCASCHLRGNAFADVRQISIGAEGDSGTRNAQPIFNMAWKRSFFWDGRAHSLREQALEPIQNPIEMHSTLPEMVERLRESPQYPPMFEAAFGDAEISADRVARALEQFMLSVVSSDSRFDRAMRGEGELSAEERRGFELFNTEYDPARGMRGADCFHCHGGALFRSAEFANNGLDAVPKDEGRKVVTRSEADAGKFAVPSLRNVALTSPYMHDGRFVTLEEVVAHYDHGLKQSATLDPNLAKHPREGLGLSAEDQRALVAFLKSLTDENFAKQEH